MQNPDYLGPFSDSTTGVWWSFVTPLFPMAEFQAETEGVDGERHSSELSSTCELSFCIHRDRYRYQGTFVSIWHGRTDPCFALG